MDDLVGRVAVVTGGASGIGRALVDAFIAERMRVVVADVEQGALDAAVTSWQETGADVAGVRTDVSSYDSVAALADAVYGRHGACHVLCNNAGVGAPSAKVWDTTPNDWRWVHGVNVLGVAHGIQAFVPRMLAGGEPGHVVNTSSTDGGVSPMPGASVYAASKAAVTSLTECLAAQLVADGTALRASIFYPSGGLLRTGLWTTERNRPAELARERPRDTTPMTPEALEAMAAKGGRQLRWQPLDELARMVVDGIRAERFVIMKGLEDVVATLHERAELLAAGRIPQTSHGVSV